MEITLGIVIGLIISWLFAWVIQPLLFKDKNSIEARFTRIERYLAQSEKRLRTVEAVSTTQMTQLQGLVNTDLKQSRFQFLRLRFRQTMGVVFILKPFIPLIMLLMLGLFGYLMVNDIRNDETISASIDQVAAHIEVVQTDIQNLSNVLGQIRQDFAWVESVIGVVATALSAIGSFINTIVDGLNTIDIFDLFPDIPDLEIDIPGFRHITESIDQLLAISNAMQAIFAEIEPLYVSLKTIVVKWWGYAKLLFFFIVGWLSLSTLATAYSNIHRGLELIRQQPPLLSTPIPNPTKKKGQLLKAKS
ncbi:MAG: hypothetical protein AAF629_34680 [Chloroflexota bacterium]